MTRIAILAAGIILTILLVFVFQYPLWLSGVIALSVMMAFLATYRDKPESQSITLIALNLFFSLLILLVFGTRSEWTQAHLTLFLALLSMSTLSGSLERLIFSGKRQFPAFTLLFVLLFWLPVIFVAFMVVQRRLGLPGGVGVGAVLMLIVFRDIVRRKKEFDAFDEDGSSPNTERQ